MGTMNGVSPSHRTKYQVKKTNSNSLNDAAHR